MTPEKVLWRGRDVDAMSRDELIAAFKEAARLVEGTLARERRNDETLRELREAVRARFNASHPFQGNWW